MEQYVARSSRVPTHTPRARFLRPGAGPRWAEEARRRREPRERGPRARANKQPDMVVNRHKYFRWTRRTAFLATMYVVVVPATLGYFGYITDGKWDMRGKRRGDTISEF
ncbi:hypothetical protein B5807_07014 [Epicoccum nigrum]|uniref:Complex I-B15 n=1 Tax=Epicoccum nigrum TaxID=105696 RepID=A0A1Y2LYU8_EPING|nr:hypothetical protein B5807_07014 [Epicoccum nigrum]